MSVGRALELGLGTLVTAPPVPAGDGSAARQNTSSQRGAPCRSFATAGSILGCPAWTVMAHLTAISSPRWSRPPCRASFWLASPPREQPCRTDISIPYGFVSMQISEAIRDSKQAAIAESQAPLQLTDLLLSASWLFSTRLGSAMSSSAAAREAPPPARPPDSFSRRKAATELRFLAACGAASISPASRSEFDRLDPRWLASESRWPLPPLPEAPLAPIAAVQEMACALPPEARSPCRCCGGGVDLRPGIRARCGLNAVGW